MNPFLLPAKRVTERAFQPLPASKRARINPEKKAESNSEQTKEDRIIDGTFYEGDSE